MLVSVGVHQKLAARADCAGGLSAEGLEAALARCAALDGIDEVAVVATRSLVEVFASTSCPAAATLAIRRALGAWVAREVPLLERHGAEAFRHLVRLASGAEAAVAGEPEILAQVKGAFDRAARSGFAGKELAAWVESAAAIATFVRREVGDSATSWGDAARELAEKVIGPLDGRRVALVGASEAASVAGRHLREAGAVMVGVTGDALDAELLRCDVVVSAEPVAPAPFRPDAIARIAAARRRPILILDLAARGAVAPETGRIRDVYLCDLGDVERVLRGAIAERAAVLSHAVRLIDEVLARPARDAAWQQPAPSARPSGGIAHLA